MFGNPEEFHSAQAMLIAMGMVQQTFHFRYPGDS
jgi:hypothetical protein